MLKTFAFTNLLAVSILTSSLSEAASRVQFYPGNFNMSVNITERDLTGAIDSDAADLYLTMNVEEQDSMMGKGKSITTAERDFNMVCSQARKHCSVILKKSNNVVIDSTNKYASFKLTGELAKSITTKFKLNERGEAFFTASDKQWRLYGNSDSFIFETTVQ